MEKEQKGQQPGGVMISTLGSCQEDCSSNLGQVGGDNLGLFS